MKVVIINSKDKNCGIHQYGEDIYHSLKKSTRIDFSYAECSDRREVLRVMMRPRVDAIIYNYYPTTMPYVDESLTRTQQRGIDACNVVQLGIMHEVTQYDADKATRALFDYWLCPDPTLLETNSIIRKTRRLVPNYYNTQKCTEIPTIGSFGFGFNDKGFDKLVERVCAEFDEAIINLHMPKHHSIGDSFLSTNSNFWTVRRCRKKVNKRGITLNITHNFLTKPELLSFLASNSINCFFYDVNKNKGISSVIDSALAVQRPIAVNKCGMFRHLFTEPRIFIEDNSLTEIIKRGYKVLHPFVKEWNETAFIRDYERILEGVLTNGTSSKRQDVYGYKHIPF
jgi:hypothetical protein